AGISRYTFDAWLARRAVEQGATVLTETRVEDWRTKSEAGRFEADLSSGETLQAEGILIGTGRVLAAKIKRERPDLPFVGFKAHFDGVDMEETLEMHLTPGAYVGLSNIGPNRVNCACIADAKRVTSMEGLLPKKLAGAEMVFSEWMALRAPRFSLQDVPDWPDAYFIGDAAGSIFPATGDGLAMGLTSGRMVADYAIKGDAGGFRAAWKKRYASRIRWGRVLHEILMKPVYARSMMTVCGRWPGIAESLFRRTRE
ncbi:MAG: hypothetical protein AAF492_23065, partial [Verrucomicrobiota bacterium]